MTVRIAVAYNEGEIYEHFGHCQCFAVYEYGETAADCKKTLIDSSGRQGHGPMVELMKEHKVDAVIAGNMGPEAQAQLLSCGIVPVIGYTGDADTAADMLVTGQLPPNGQAGGCCSGGCGGCGGGCGGGEDEGGCGCGGGCC